MTLQRRIAVTLAGAILTVGAAMLAHAQHQQPPFTPVSPVTPRVLADGDVGFRIVGMRGQTPVGQLVVRINGEWVKAASGHDPRFQMR